MKSQETTLTNLWLSHLLIQILLKLMIAQLAQVVDTTVDVPQAAQLDAVTVSVSQTFCQLLLTQDQLSIISTLSLPLLMLRIELAIITHKESGSYHQQVSTTLLPLLQKPQQVLLLKLLAWFKRSQILILRTQELETIALMDNGSFQPETLETSASISFKT